MREKNQKKQDMDYYVNLCHWEVYRVEISGGL